MKLKRKTPVYTVTIHYKSGLRATGRFTKFNVKYNSATLTSIEWATPADARSKPLYIGDLSDIESIWQTDA